MKFMRFFLIGLASTFIAGCSSTPSKVTTGAIRARSFSFVNINPNTANFAEKREPFHAMIQKAIVTDLSRKGVSHVASGGDVTVAYLLVVGNNASTLAVNDYFGYGRDATALADKAQKAYDSSKNPGYFEAGTLLIDIISPQSGQLLWRGHATKPVLREATDDVRAQRIQEAVSQILGGLQIGQ
jgi:PBP1b-binding outer membrane lipoprotein LpoB